MTPADVDSGRESEKTRNEAATEAGTSGPMAQIAARDKSEITAEEFLKNVPTWEEQLAELRVAFPGLTDEQIEALIP